MFFISFMYERVDTVLKLTLVNNLMSNTINFHVFFFCNLSFILVRYFLNICLLLTKTGMMASVMHINSTVLNITCKLEKLQKNQNILFGFVWNKDDVFLSLTYESWEENSVFIKSTAHARLQFFRKGSESGDVLYLFAIHS